MEVRVPSLTKTVQLELKTPVIDERPVYVSGNFCKWLPDLEEYQMKQTGPGEYQFTFTEEMDLPEVIEYKYTRGGWDQVELNSDGEAPLNRVIKPGKNLVKDFVPHWRRNGVSLNTDYMPIVEVLADDFETTELRKKRKVHLLLPYDYYDHPKRRYPVLYLTDAQNLFGTGSQYGNWGIDRKLAVLAARDRGNVIIVAIDHGGRERVREFSPYDSEKHGKGKGKEFLKFVTKTLKKAVDGQYRTLPDRLNTGMGGSSMGGLLTAYAGLMHPDVFGKLMVFSPSLWLSPKIFFDATHFFEPFESRMYFYGGNREGSNMVNNLKKLHKSLETQGYGYDRVKMNLQIDPEGQHREERWGEEFPKALEWLYY